MSKLQNSERDKQITALLYMHAYFNEYDLILDKRNISKYLKLDKLGKEKFSLSYIINDHKLGYIDMNDISNKGIEDLGNDFYITNINLSNTTEMKRRGLNYYLIKRFKIPGRYLDRGNRTRLPMIDVNNTLLFYDKWNINYKYLLERIERYLNEHFRNSFDGKANNVVIPSEMIIEIVNGAMTYDNFTDMIKDQEKITECNLSKETPSSGDITIEKLDIEMDDNENENGIVMVDDKGNDNEIKKVFNTDFTPYTNENTTHYGTYNNDDKFDSEIQYGYYMRSESFSGYDDSKDYRDFYVNEYGGSEQGNGPDIYELEEGPDGENVMKDDRSSYKLLGDTMDSINKDELKRDKIDNCLEIGRSTIVIDCDSSPSDKNDHDVIDCDKVEQGNINMENNVIIISDSDSES